MKKILLLEDELVLWRLYKEKLEKSGYKVTHVKNIDEAEKSLRLFLPDIAILDHWISWDEKTWVYLISKIKSMYEEAKVIILTNYHHFSLRKRAHEAGADDFLLKIDHSPAFLAKYLKENFA